jgi:branched-chain amino acid transport system permease protein
MDYLFTIGTMICCYAILASSFNLLLGITGLFALSHAAFYGLGAYTAALFDVDLGLPAAVGLVAAMAVAGTASLLISIPSLRISGDYLVIASLGFQFVVFAVLNNLKSITRGPAGIPGIHRPTIFGNVLDTPGSYLILALATAALCVGVAGCISRSPFGRLLRAIREDEIAVRALGKDVTRAKIVIFTVASSLAGAAGWLFAHQSSFVSPEMFMIDESIYVLAMVLVGGAGSTRGAVLGSVLLVTLPELLRFADLPSAVAGASRQMVYAAVLLLFLLLRPRGILQEGGPSSGHVLARLVASR